MSKVNIWNFLAKWARQFMKVWGANVGSDLKVCKARFLVDIQVVDAHADSVRLLDEEWIMRYALEDELITIYCQEEIYWSQRGTIKLMLWGCQHRLLQGYCQWPLEAVFDSSI